MSDHWYTSSRFRSTALIILAIALTIQAFHTLVKENDYVWHTNAGNDFVAGDPFRGGTWYPLSRMMFNVIPAQFPHMLGKGLVGLLALICLSYCFRAFTEMTLAESRWDPRRNFAACIFAFAAMAPYINRDLDDAGLQCLLLGMLVLGGMAMWRGQPLRAGFWLGTGAAYKFTPLLFLPVLLWKRQWRAGAALLVVAVGWNLLPAAFIGWDKTAECHQRWWAQMVKSSSVRDIAENGIEPPNGANQALMAACARYLQAYPEGHPMHIAHPLSFDIGQLDHETANIVAKGIMLTLALAIAWGMRRGWKTQDPRLPYEWAVTCIFAALVSPMCWRQHLVLALPAGNLVWRTLLAAPKISRPQVTLAIGLAVLGLLPQRDLWQAEFTETLLCYKLDTLALLGYTVLLFRVAPVSAVKQPALAVPAPPLPQPRAA